MKKNYFLIAIFASILLASCFEAEEKTVINKDNSGTYSITMDISGMMQQMQAITGKSITDEMGAAKSDSVIYFKNFTDTSAVLTTEEKEMLKDGSMNIHIDNENDDMKFVISIPFKNVTELQKLKQELAVAMKKINLTDKLMNDSATDELSGMMQKGPDASMVMNPIEGAYSLSIDNKMISNKLVDSSFVDRLLSGNSNLQMIKQMAPMFGDLKYKTTYVLPVEIKNYKGSNPELSSDRKTISFTSGLTNLFDTPAILEYQVTY
ncbi:MAG TPA: hypothetical protein PLP23_17510 [Panacibacter sp.]|nr:hypothetical protein [Panacibacter sp.]